MHHQAQKGFHGIFVGNSQHQKWYLVYVPHAKKLISSYCVVFDDISSSTLAYTSKPYSEAMDLSPDVPYITYDKSPREKTGDIITFAKFEEGYLLSGTQNLSSETRDDTEISNKYYDDSTMPPLIIEEEMDTMSVVISYCNSLTNNKVRHTEL